MKSFLYIQNFFVLFLKLSLILLDVCPANRAGDFISNVFKVTGTNGGNHMFLFYKDASPLLLCCRSECYLYVFLYFKCSINQLEIWRNKWIRVLPP